jgi:hypothetical protein
VLSPSRIILEYNGKIRPQPDRENAFARASSGDEGSIRQLHFLTFFQYIIRYYKTYCRTLLQQFAMPGIMGGKSEVRFPIGHSNIWVAVTAASLAAWNFGIQSFKTRNRAQIAHQIPEPLQTVPKRFDPCATQRQVGGEDISIGECRFKVASLAFSGVPPSDLRDRLCFGHPLYPPNLGLNVEGLVLVHGFLRFVWGSERCVGSVRLGSRCGRTKGPRTAKRPR